AVERALEGWQEEVEEQTSSALRVVDAAAEDDAPFPLERPWEAMPVVVEAAVPPSKLDATIVGDAWGALAGVGLAWVGLGWPNGELVQVRDRVRSIGGIGPVVRGPGRLGESPVAAPEVQRRLKQAFDPHRARAAG